MRVLLTGATGYIGSAVLDRLRERGHEVVAVVRSEESAEKVRAAGADPLVHELANVEWLMQALGDVDALVHLAADDDAASMDDAVIDAVMRAFAGTTKRIVLTGGIWIWGDGDVITEDSPFDPPALTAWRVDDIGRLLGSGLHASVISPGVVYGHGRGLTELLRGNEGAVRLVGSGAQHWPLVHVDDLAELYVIVLEQAPPGEHWIGASGDNPTVREIGEAMAGPGGRVDAEDVASAREWFGADLADALLLDQQADGLKAKTRVGWEPSRPSLITSLTTG